MSLGPHRLTMNLFGLMVIFSRDDAFRTQLRDLKLADCPLYVAYREQLMTRSAADPSGSASAHTDGTTAAAPAACAPGSRAEAPPGSRQWFRRRLLSHPLFSADITPLDLASHAVESSDDFYAYIGASVVAYQMGADEGGESPQPDPADTSSASSCDSTGRGASARVDGSDRVVVTADPALLASPPGSGAGAMGATAGGGGASAASLPSPACAAQRLALQRAQKLHRSGLPREVVGMLLDAAKAGLANQMYKGFAAYLKVHTYLAPLAVIAIADVNKATITHAGGVEVAAEALSHPDERSRQFAAQLLWLLAFNAEANARICANPKALEGLRAIAASGSGQARSNAQGALWQLQKPLRAGGEGSAGPAAADGTAAMGATPTPSAFRRELRRMSTGATDPIAMQAPHTDARTATGLSSDDSSAEVLEEATEIVSAVMKTGAQPGPGQGHVMLSYQWADQALIVAMKQALVRAGYVVWLDLECMAGSTLAAMAEAVEGAAVVVMAVSRKYRESANCRSEAECE
jgi:hypothetical protein